jgi:hypothetical protein
METSLKLKKNREKLNFFDFIHFLHDISKIWNKLKPEQVKAGFKSWV